MSSKVSFEVYFLAFYANITLKKQILLIMAIKMAIDFQINKNIT